MTTRSEWTEYYDEHEGREPREMLLEVLDAFGAGEERSAVDLGCGSGIDTLAMLRRGWRVCGHRRRLPLPIVHRSASR